MRRAPLACLLVAIPLAAQMPLPFDKEHGLWYAAYADAEAALKRGDFGEARRLYQKAASLGPKPGRQRPYGMTFIEFHPWVRIAQCCLELKELEAASQALRKSTEAGGEPAREREALEARLRTLQTARQAPPKEATERSAPPSPPVLTVLVPVQSPQKQEPEPLAVPAPSQPGAASVPSPQVVQDPKPAPPAEAAAPKAQTPAVGPIALPAKGKRAPKPAPRSFPVWLVPGLAGVGLAGLGAWILGRLRRRRQRRNPYHISLSDGGSSPWGSSLSFLPQSQAEAEPPPVPAPSQVGPYRVERVLGRGGCATTYAAVHAKSRARVALKLPHPHIALDPDFRARFRREASLGTLLDHPHIVRIVDPGPQEGETWMAMDFVEGITLEAHLRQTGPLPVAQAIHIAADMASAMAHAHAKGIVHRDLKPSNVMLGEQGALVLDFGICRILDAAQTATTLLMGTPSYFAPEGLDNARVGPAADRYALGIMLFEMLTGSLPFRGDTAFQILEKHRKDPLPDLGVLRQELPAPLVRLVDRLCQKLPGERPEDGEVLAILEGLKAELPLG